VTAVGCTAKLQVRSPEVEAGRNFRASRIHSRRKEAGIESAEDVKTSLPLFQGGKRTEEKTSILFPLESTGRAINTREREFSEKDPVVES